MTFIMKDALVRSEGDGVTTQKPKTLNVADNKGKKVMESLVSVDL